MPAFSVRDREQAQKTCQ